MSDGNQHNKRNKRTTWDAFRDFTTEDPMRALVMTGVAVGGGLAAFAASRFRVCNPNQMLVRTGLLIEDIAVSKKGMQLPFQKYQFINMDPVTHRFQLKAMSKQHLETDLPVDVVARPFHPENDLDAFKDYARYMTGDIDENRTPKQILSATLEGHLRTLMADRDMDEIFRGEGRQDCNKAILEHLQVEMRVFGMDVTSAQIRSMGDKSDDDKYFGSLKQRAVKAAEFVAEMDVARTERECQIEVETNHTTARKKVAEQQREAQVYENACLAEIAVSDATLAEANAEKRRREDVATVYAEVAAREVRAEREASLHEKERITQEQYWRSKELAKATVHAETIVREAEGDADKIRRLADAALYKAEQEAAGDLLRAEAKAKGERAVLMAQAEGMNELLEAYNQNPEAALIKLSIDSGYLHVVAEKQAEAMQGLKPEISIFQSSGDNALADMAKSIVPVAGALNKHLGLTEKLGLRETKTEAKN